MAQQAKMEEASAAARELTKAQLELLNSQNLFKVADNAQELAGKAVALWNVLEILRAGRPAAGTPERSVYDAAVNRNGGAKADVKVAIQALEKIHVDMIKNLHAKASDASQLGNSAAAVHAMCVKIQDGIVMGTYPTYETYFRGNEFAELDNVSLGGVKQVAITSREVPRSAAPLPVFDINLMDLGSIQLVSHSGQQAVQTVGTPVVTPTIRSMFGLNEDNAGKFLETYALAASYRANHMQDDPNMQKPEAQQICKDLLSYIDKIPASKEIMDASKHPNFDQAVRSLRAGNLYLALNYLGQETSFNSVYSALSNFYVISVDQRAVAVFRGGTNIKWQFDKNQRSFERYIKDLAGPEPLEPKVVYFGMGLYYQYLNMSGQLQQMQATATGLTPVGGAKRVTGTGHVAEAQGSIGVATSSIIPWKKASERWVPMTVVLHCSGGYREWGMGTTLDVGGTAVPLKSEENGGYLGIWGAEFQFPGKEAHVGRIRVNRIGAAGVGTAEGYLAYISFAMRATKGNNWRMEAIVTPQFSNFLGQSRYGGELRPAEITRQWTTSSVTFGPGIQYEFNSANQNSTVQVYGQMRYQAARGIDITAKAGWVGEFFGSEVERIPKTFFGDLRATITIPKLFQKQQPRAREVQPPYVLLSGDYLDAVDYATTKKDSITAIEAQNKAVDLAAAFKGFVAPKGYEKQYRQAMTLLSAGKLSEGIAILREIPDFKKLESR